MPLILLSKILTSKDALQHDSEEASTEASSEGESGTSVVEGLAKLDAGKEEDKSSIESKIEEVASAMGLEDPPKVLTLPFRNLLG